VVFLFSAGLASAQNLSLEFRDGKVRLKAENVPVARILAEWARLGGTNIVHGERVPGAPLTLQLTDVSEQQALDIILRGAAGYMALARETTPAGASTLDKILVLPTTTRTPATAAAAPPPPPPVAQPGPFADRAEQVDVDDQDEPPQPPATSAPNPFPRAGRLPPGINAPSAVPQQQQQGGAALDEDSPPPTTGPAPTPGNPFTGIQGGARPGTVNPPPPQNQQRGR
jgi:hypothetical protein